MLSIPESIFIANAFYFSEDLRISFATIRDCSNEFMKELCNRKRLFVTDDDLDGYALEIKNVGRFICLDKEVILGKFDKEAYKSYLEKVFYDEPGVLDALYISGERWGKKVKNDGRKGVIF